MEITKEKLQTFIEDFEKNPITTKWIESVENRGKFQREMDKSFYDLSKSTINKLIDLIILMNTLHGGSKKINESIEKQQIKYLEIVEDLENTIKKL